MTDLQLRTLGKVSNKQSLSMKQRPCKNKAEDEFALLEVCNSAEARTNWPEMAPVLSFVPIYLIIKYP